MLVRSLRVLAETSTEAHGAYRRGPFVTKFPDSMFALGFVRRLPSGEWLRSPVRRNDDPK